MQHVVGVEEVRKVAALARLSLTDAELKAFVPQLDAILRYVQQLKAVSTEGVDPTSHVLRLSNITRSDAAAPCLGPEAVVSLAPDRHGQLVKVPKIVET